MTMRDAIQTLLASFTTCPVTQPNEQFSPPSPPSPWVYAETTGLGADLMGVGAHNVTAQHGFLRLHIMIPFGAGMDLAYSIADQLTGIFASAQPITGLQFDAATLPEVGAASDDGVYFGISVSVPFTYWNGT